jgi:phenylacetate-CoA ligase
MATLVTQCEHGSYHVNPEFGVLELLRGDQPVGPGEYGEIVATGFVNQVMPIIRYATGDLAMWKEGSCPCGRSFPMLERIEGRRDDVIVTPEGRRIGRLDPIFKAVSSIFEAQIVQESPDLVRVYVVGSEFNERERLELGRELQKRLGPSMRIDIVQTERIARTKSGKFRSVVNLVGRPDAEFSPHE